MVAFGPNEPEGYKYHIEKQKLPKPWFFRPVAREIGSVARETPRALTYYI